MTTKLFKKIVTFSERDTVHIIPNEKWTPEQIGERHALLHQAVAEYQNECYWAFVGTLRPSIKVWFDSL